MTLHSLAQLLRRRLANKGALALMLPPGTNLRAYLRRIPDEEVKAVVSVTTPLKSTPP
jgi:hypothetical protein